MNEKNGLTTDARRKPKINEYFEDGYKVTEMFFPHSNTYMVTKEKGNNVFYYYRTSTSCTKGMYNKAEFDKRMRDFNRQMDEWNALLDQKMSDWETKCDEWSKKVDERLKSSFGSGYTSFPDFPEFPEFPAYSTPFSGVSQTTTFSDDFGRMFDELLLEDGNRSSTSYNTSGNRHGTSRTTQQRSYYRSGKSTHSNTSSSNGSCLGCLLWSIFFLCIVCVILYGMGVLGANIIHFIVDLFKSLF